jgi:hypothetical protein
MNEATALNINAYDAILCVGGDGTVNEVVNGLANRPDARQALERLPIATIPAGSLLLTFSDVFRIRYGWTLTQLTNRKCLVHEFIRSLSSHLRRMASRHRY